ncbi:hypothetical protein EJ04DRAFT_73507 [Polyplosphaeria fusca]|uniref:Uncharacterized protein n=1 Tax=Polyplosphaeria fusca TaxID=682080 RepID=A0A9P4UUZ1_9PLEO|nr:hypothetical protein EJ04DRAFT_73507 [Polyplosphaeria fusca]
MEEFRSYRVEHVYATSTQDTPYQQEVNRRLHLPYDLFSDLRLEFARALNLSLFD